MTDERKELAHRLRNTHLIQSGDFARIADLLDPPQPEGGIAVRIAVAIDGENGDMQVWAIKPEYGVPESAAWAGAKCAGYPIRLGIVTAVLPPPPLPVVAGEVERS